MGQLQSRIALRSIRATALPPRKKLRNLNVLYDPRIKAGMTVGEVKAVLPEVLADVRVWVRKVNNLAE